MLVPNRLSASGCHVHTEARQAAWQAESAPTQLWTETIQWRETVKKFLCSQLQALLGIQGINNPVLSLCPCRTGRLYDTGTAGHHPPDKA